MTTNMRSTRSMRTGNTRRAKVSNSARPENDEPELPVPHGFFPAITHFSDAVAALPKEVIRHFTMLKESEGKAYPPNESIKEIIERIEQLPTAPHSSVEPYMHAMIGMSINNSINGSATASIIDGFIPNPQRSDLDMAEQAFGKDEPSRKRTELHAMLRSATKAINMILDEKNMILNSANDTLARQLARLEDTLPHVEKELSEEARLGSNTHWALAHMKAARRGAQSQSARRDAQGASSLVAAAQVLHETDIAAVRSDARRDAVRAQKRPNLDSDFDERPASKRAPQVLKPKRAQETLGGTDGKATVTSQTKRRRVEKPAGPVIDRVASVAVNGRVAVPGRLIQEVRKKPKALAVSVPKKRNDADSASVASSPVTGTFATRPNKDESPHSGAVRARQNSALSIKSLVNKERPSSSASHSRGQRPGTPELRVVANVTARTISEVKQATRDAYITTEGGHVIEQDGVAGALVVEGAPEPGLKEEDTSPLDVNGPQAAQDINSALEIGSSLSHTAINEATDAPLMARSRSTRGINNKHTTSSPALEPAQPVRSHHKAARNGTKARSPPHGGIVAAAAAAPGETRGSHQASDDANGVPSTPDPDSDEPTYCICNQPSYGSMVGCDNPNCAREWFHLECVGLTEEPEGNTKWYCNDCKKTQKRRHAPSNGR